MDSIFSFFNLVLKFTSSSVGDADPSVVSDSFESFHAVTKLLKPHILTHFVERRELSFLGDLMLLF